jgi:hypothetical protein
VDKIAQAAKLYEDFSGHEPTRVRVRNVRDDDTLLHVGETEAIAYNARRDGKRDSYIHEFRKGSRPLLAASHDGKRLYLLDGAYRFTDRGITDRRRMAQIALVNPSKRKKMAHRKRPRTAAQRAATAKLLAWNRQHRRRTGHPKKATSRYVNPHGRHSYHPHKGRKHNPSHRHHYRRRHNPEGMLTEGFWQAEVMPAVIGAGTAIAADLVIGFIPMVPTVLQSGLPRQLTRIAAVMGISWAGGKVMKSRRVSEEVAAAGIGVVLYDMLKGFLVQQFPTLPLQPVATVVLPTTTAAGTATAAAGTAGWISPAMALSDYSQGTGYAGETEYNYEGMGSYVDGMGDVGAYVEGVEVRSY